jgi:hypothetical protein
VIESSFQVESLLTLEPVASRSIRGAILPPLFPLCRVSADRLTEPSRRAEGNPVTSRHSLQPIHLLPHVVVAIIRKNDHPSHIPRPLKLLSNSSKPLKNLPSPHLNVRHRTKSCLETPNSSSLEPRPPRTTRRRTL